jgi:hypothetical protein
MFNPQYEAGERVRVSSRSLSGPSSGDEFKVIKRYPVEGMEPLYRIKSVSSPHERMVPGSEMKRVPTKALNPDAVFRTNP